MHTLLNRGYIFIFHKNKFVTPIFFGVNFKIYSFDLNKTENL